MGISGLPLALGDRVRRPTRLPGRLAVALATVATLGCGFSDIFASAGLRPVEIVYQGDTILGRDSTVPFNIVVVAGDEPLDRPHLEISSSDTSVFTLTASGDSIHAGARVTKAVLTVRLLSSILTDSTPALYQNIHVKP
jgi:hypothetical protein